MRKRYVLIRPIGGLNDMFNQIYRCCVYCRKFNRTLLVDSRKCNFSAVFTDYFTGISIDMGNFEEWIRRGAHEGASSYPEQVNIERFDYETFLKEGSGICYLRRDGQPITFDFSRDYPQDILVHHACGGGAYGGRGFDMFAVNHHIRRELWNRLQTIGGKFTAIHIRNTDLKTDYEDYFGRIMPRVRKYPRLFLATDDRKVLDFFTRHGVDFHSFSTTISTDGRPVHNQSFPGDIRLRNTESILDVLTLSAADKIIFTDTHWQKPSGFVLLAQGLKSVKYIKKRLS